MAGAAGSVASGGTQGAVSGKVPGVKGAPIEALGGLLGRKKTLIALFTGSTRKLVRQNHLCQLLRMTDGPQVTSVLPASLCQFFQ